MGLALALIGLTSLAVALLLVPLLLRQRLGGSSEAYNLAVYRDQLAEVERDLGRGLLSAEQAEAARAEIGRRILALAPIAAAPRALSPTLLVLATACVVSLPFAAWSVYWQIGSPSVPDQPLAERKAGGAATAAGGAGAPHLDMTQAVTQLAARLQEHPEDLNGWLLLGRANVGLGRYQEAAEAYRRGAELSGQRPDILGDWGEAQVLVAGGTVTPAARQAFAAGLKDPETSSRSRYYLALAELQQGNAKAALQGWVDLEADSPAGADWLPLLRKRIVEAATAQGVDPATLKTTTGKPRPAPSTAAAAPAVPTPAATATPAPSGAPNSETVAAVARATAGASPEERQAMIRGMVANLAAKMAQNPDDADGWTRLGRSYMVLNEPDKARDAYARAVKLKPSDIALKQAYADAIVTAAGNAAGPPEEAIAVLREVLAAIPTNQEALWYVGLAEAMSGRKQTAIELWTRLLAQLPAASPERKELEQRLADLKGGIKPPGQ